MAAAHRLISEKGENWTALELAKEAGVALQTFYRYFGGKDQLLLAVIEDMMTSSVAEYERVGRQIKDPVARLRYYVTVVFSSLVEGKTSARFVTAQHWRLHQLFPDALAEANKPLADLIADGIRDAQAEAQLPVIDPDWAAQFINRLLMVEYHFYAYATAEVEIDEIADRVWGFCLTGLGATGLTVEKAATPRSRTAGA